MRVAFLGNHSVSYSSETHHAASLEALGHTVERLQEPKASADEIVTAATAADLMVWVHTHGWDTPQIGDAVAALRWGGTPIIAYHLDLYMGLRRWRDYEQSLYMHGVDHFFTVDRLMADWLNANTNTRGHYMPAAVFGPEAYISDQGSPDSNDVVFVGSRGYHPEWPYRPKLLDWLKSTYGQRFTHVGGDGQVKTTRGDALNRLYAGSKIVVGDSLCPNFDYPGYWSDRVYETLGRGGFLIHPFVEGMQEHFTDGEHLVFYPYGDFDQLRFLIDYYLQEHDEREQIRRTGHEHVKARHTYQHRWAAILDAVATA